MKTSAANAEASTKLFKKLGQELAEANTKITQVTEQRDGAQKKIVAEQAEIDRLHAKLDEKKRQVTLSGRAACEVGTPVLQS
jgi:peptidoglycan hydrolase CwlO-like protein